MPLVTPGARWLRTGYWVLGTCLLVGCSGLQGERPAGDPLTGGGPPIPNNAQTAGNAQPAPAAPKPPPPPAPAFTAPSSAALASRAGGASGGDRGDLRISDDRGNSAWAKQGQNPPSGSGNSAGGGTGTASGAKIRRIETGSDQGQGTRLDAAVVPANSGSSFTTYEEALRKLQERGVIWHRLEQAGDGGWRFACSVPSRTNPGARRTHEAQDADYLSAIRAVLEQIEREQR